MNAASPPPPLIGGSSPALTSDVSPGFPVVLMFLVWIAIVVVATLVTFIVPETFASTARIKVDSDQIWNQRPATNAYDPQFIPTQLEIITSETILGRVIDILNLNEVWMKRYLDGGSLKASESFALLRARLEVRQVPNTTLLDIRVCSENPREAADLANAIAEAYAKWRLDRVQGEAKGGLPGTGPVEVLERAVASTKPARPNKPLNLILGFVFGGVAGFSLAMLVYVVKHSTHKQRHEVVA
jgi:uncharacterized protein involved in exopolysaccharide biosynthesis